MRRRAVLAAMLALLAGPAFAQSAADPVETVRAFYAADDINAVRFYARSLRALYERDRREAKGEVGRLGFAFPINGQDTEPDFARSLALARLPGEGTGPRCGRPSATAARRNCATFSCARTAPGRSPMSDR